MEIDNCFRSITSKEQLEEATKDMNTLTNAIGLETLHRGFFSRALSLYQILVVIPGHLLGADYIANTSLVSRTETSARVLKEVLGLLK